MCSCFRGGSASPRVGQPHVLRFRVVGRREVAPRQRPLLAIGLAERDREAGPRQLLAQIEGVRRLVDVELGEDLGDAGTSVPRTKRSLFNTVIAVASAKMRKFGIGDAGLQRAQLVFA